MYTPPSNAETRPDVLLDFIEANPLATLVTMTTEGLLATHLPVILDRSPPPYGVLRGHIARANPHHRQTFAPGEALVIVLGPDAYISPSWYPSKLEHGKAVPTWNYIAVHAYGRLRFTDEPAFIRAHLEALTALHESRREHPWAISDAPADFIAGQERSVIGLELEITRLEGRWKMSQNRPPGDIDGVVRELSASPDPVDRYVAGIVQARRPDRKEKGGEGSR
jgi:transcriptional regulator